MNSIEILDNFNVLPFKRRYNRGFKPHFSLRIDGIDFHIDSSPGIGYNLITHAHSDHYGFNNLKNYNAVMSEETVKILNTIDNRKNRRFRGIRFQIGDSLNLSGVKIKTYPTFHIIGSSAFLFKEYDILITGDVKNYYELPKCSLLITEATYADPSHTFEDEVDRLIEEAENNPIFGVYPVGKAQRVAEILIKSGFGFKGDDKIERICEALGLNPSDGPTLLPPRVASMNRGFIITAQKFYRNRIVISDHLDYRGLIEMIEHCDPEHVIFYHGKPTKRFLYEIKRMGYSCSTLEDIDIFL